MADKNIAKAKRAERRRKRVRSKISGTADRPRLTVSKSLNNIFAQIINDESGVTLVAAASNSKLVKEASDKPTNKVEMAKSVGAAIAGAAKDKGIETVVFDRNQNRFQGRIKALAEAAREAGLKF